MKPHWYDFTTIVTDIARVEPRTDERGSYPGGWNITLALGGATNLKLFFRDELFKFPLGEDGEMTATPNVKVGQPLSLGIEMPLKEGP